MLVYSDAAAWGGHEIMVNRLARGWLAEGIQLAFAVSGRNPRLRAAVQALATAYPSRVQFWLLPFCTRSAQELRALCMPRRAAWVARKIRDCNPDVVVIAQGVVEAGAVGVLGAMKAGVPAVAYVATARSVRSEGRPLAWLRDPINARFLYRRLTGAVAVSEAQRRELISRGVPPQRAGVLDNFLCGPPPQMPPQSKARAKLGLNQADFIIGLAGRIAFRDKGQDLFARALRAWGAPDISVLVAGDGPDEPRLRWLLSGMPLATRARWLGWQEDLTDFFAAIDLLAVPSRREGVPLVMIEAVLRGKPVAASAVDGMAAWLPAKWLFPVGHAAATAAVLERFRSGGARAEIAATRERFQRVFLRRSGPQEFLDKLGYFCRLGLD